MLRPFVQGVERVGPFVETGEWAAGKMKGWPHTLTLEERACLFQVQETRQLKIGTLCKNIGLQGSALYKNLTLARLLRPREVISAVHFRNSAVVF
ncbi:hypothetical protein ABIB34_000442 [Rhodococcus sp. UYP5]